MSRIGKKPIYVPENVTANIVGSKIEVRGPNGNREFNASKEVLVELAENNCQNLFRIHLWPYHVSYLYVVYETSSVLAEAFSSPIITYA